MGNCFDLIDSVGDFEEVSEVEHLFILSRNAHRRLAMFAWCHMLTQEWHAKFIQFDDCMCVNNFPISYIVFNGSNFVSLNSKVVYDLLSLWFAANLMQSHWARKISPKPTKQDKYCTCLLPVEHTTPASSLWSHFVLPHGLCLHCIKRDSRPRHETSSNHTVPWPGPNAASPKATPSYS